VKVPRQQLVLALVLLAGAGLRVWQYLANTSLWIDELGLAENVMHLPLSALLGQPLFLDQVAPPAFLAALKAAAAIFGPSELALRLVPLLGGLVSLPLFALLARRILAGWTAVFATAAFSLAPSLVAYSSELKQYSTDVAVAVLLMLAALDLCGPSRTRRAALTAALLGMGSVWFSQPAVLQLAGLGAGIAWIALRRGGWPALRPLAPVLAAWAAAAAAATALGFHSLSPSTRAYMQSFWQPSLPRPVVLAVVVLACAVLWAKRRDVAPVLVGPAVVALAAAAFHQYPFSGRAILFLTPVALIAGAELVESLVAVLARVGLPAPVGASAFAIALLVSTALHLPPYRYEETRPVLAGLASRRAAGDAVYVYYGAERAVRFYGPRFGIGSAEADFGLCHRGEPRRYLEELDRFRGRPRVWVVFSHAVPGLAEQPTIRDYLASIGRRVETIEAPGASAELYDLSDPARLQTAAAATAPVSAAKPDAVSRFGCGHGPLGEIPPDWK
jgi:hypothetical protein